MRKLWEKHKLIILAAALLLIALAVWMVTKSGISHSIHVVRRGTFEKIIETKGEIQGKNAINILISDIFKDPDIQIWDFKIKDLVPEGTIVKKGDWVASLDQVNLNQRLQSIVEEIDVREAQLNDTRIDTALALSQMRQRIKELEYDLKYRALDLEQSKFESPAYQRKMQTNYNRTLRQIERQKRDYELRKMDQNERTKRSEDRYHYMKRVEEKIKKALEDTQVKAPDNGMVIYTRTRGNRKIRIGDEVGPWRPIIATLPDLSTLVSETFIEEIDIAKIKTGDSVMVTVDALPGEQFPGIVQAIANIGQELQGIDSRVFAVTVELRRSHPKLLPGMTSNNRIILEKRAGELIIPRNALFSEEQKPFVYLRKDGKIWKHFVETGSENDEVVVVTKGLSEKDRILTQPPGEEEKVLIYNESEH